MLKKLTIILMAIYLSGCTTYGYSFKGGNEPLSSFNKRTPAKVVVKASSINALWGVIIQPIVPRDSDIKAVLSLIPYIEQASVESEADYIINLSFPEGSYSEDEQYFLCLLTVSLIPCGYDAMSSMNVIVKDNNGTQVFFKTYGIELTQYSSLFVFPSLIAGKPDSRISKDFLYETMSDVVMKMHRKGLL